MPPMRRGMCGTCGRLGAAREPFRDRQSKQMQILSRKRFHRAQICWPSSLASYPTPQACLFAAGSAHRIRMCARSTAGWLLTGSVRLSFITTNQPARNLCFSLCFSLTINQLYKSTGAKISPAEQGLDHRNSLTDSAPDGALIKPSITE